MKILKLDLEYNENKVNQKLISDDLDEEGHHEKFSKFNNCGSSELMHCNPLLTTGF